MSELPKKYYLVYLQRGKFKFRHFIVQATDSSQAKTLLTFFTNEHHYDYAIKDLTPEMVRGFNGIGDMIKEINMRFVDQQFSVPLNKMRQIVQSNCSQKECEEFENAARHVMDLVNRFMPEWKPKNDGK